VRHSLLFGTGGAGSVRRTLDYGAVIRAFNRDQGTFRTYLRIWLDRFLANQHRFESRQKRRG
jgi:hypothetical protein